MSFEIVYQIMPPLALIAVCMAGLTWALGGQERSVNNADLIVIAITIVGISSMFGFAGLGLGWFSSKRAKA